MPSNEFDYTKYTHATANIYKYCDKDTCDVFEYVISGDYVHYVKDKKLAAGTPRFTPDIIPREDVQITAPNSGRIHVSRVVCGDDDPIFDENEQPIV